MIDVVTYTEVERRNYDPTHTTALRNAFAKDMKRRFKELVVAIRIGVDKRDCFGLRKKGIQTFQVTPPVEGAFAFVRSQEKLAAFMAWLEKQIEAGLLTVRDLEQVGTGIEAVWTNKYIYDSYKRGIMRARYEMAQLGMQIPSILDSGGVDVIMSMPMHLDRVGLLYTRVYSDLRGITQAMDTMISRILAQGMADGDGPALLARKLVTAIEGGDLGKLGLTDTLGRFVPASRRAEILARTEIIRAHHLATIQEYRNWGVEGIVVKGEWRTAGDDRVCPQCAALEGKIFTLDEIEPLIPLHRLCRCIALPYIEELLQYERK